MDASATIDTLLDRSLVLGYGDVGLRARRLWRHCASAIAA